MIRKAWRSIAGLAVACGGLMAAGTSLADDQASTAPTKAPALKAATGPAAARPAATPATEFGLTGERQQGGWIKGKVPSGTSALSLDGAPLAFDADGVFFAAFDRDAGASALLTARRQDGTLLSRALAIAPRGWQIERVNVARRGGGPTEEFMARRRPELARINAARSIRTDASGWRQSFIWPVKGRISGMFGSQRIYRGEPGAYHSGIDIATGGTGTPFVAPADGVVILAAKEPFTLEGHLLMIDHGMGLSSAFLHCSQLLVEEGAKVRQGQVIGRIGATGRATGPHLHWGMKWHGARIDPILLTGPMS